MRALGIADARAPTPGDALDVLGAAAAVIGIDTGLTHLAVQQGTPTVTICRAPAVFFRPWPHARAVVGDPCDDACIAAEKEHAYNAVVDLRGLRWQPRACPVGGRCLGSVRPGGCPPRAGERAVTASAERGAGVEVDAYPESRVHNSQPHGIGRVVALDGSWAWNNLGRNVVFAGEDFRPRAVFDESVFSEDEPSQYDLDVHAILDVPSAGIVVTLNHLGMVRAFSSDAIREPGPLRRVAPVWTRTFAPDVERAVVLGDRLVGSRPREEGAPGLLVSERLSRRGRAGPAGDARAIGDASGWSPRSWRFTTTRRSASRSAATGRWAWPPRPPTASVHCGGSSTWTSNRGSSSGTARVVWAAGCERAANTIDDYDWEALGGGGFAALDPTDGRVVVRGRFSEDLAWGNGGVAVVLVPGALCGIGRRGQVYLFDTSDGTPLTTSAPIADTSLGIAHAAAVGRSGAVRLQSGWLPPPDGSGSPVQLEAPIRHEALSTRPQVVEQRLQGGLQHASCWCNTGRRAA